MFKCLKISLPKPAKKNINNVILKVTGSDIVLYSDSDFYTEIQWKFNKPDEDKSVVSLFFNDQLIGIVQVEPINSLIADSIDEFYRVISWMHEGK